MTPCPLTKLRPRAGPKETKKKRTTVGLNFVMGAGGRETNVFFPGRVLIYIFNRLTPKKNLQKMIQDIQVMKLVFAPTPSSAGALQG